MKILKKYIIVLPIAIITCMSFLECKDKGITTGIKKIDREYKFKYKNVLKEDSLQPKMKLFYNNTLKDSIYTVGTKELGDYNIRILGWSFNQRRIGDWHYEKVYKNGKIITDSIVNYVISCDKNPRNTIKKFKNDKLDRSKGYFYEIDMNKSVFVGDTLNIRLNFVYDTLTYKNVGKELYIVMPSDFHNLCDATQSVVDSFPIIGNTAKMSLLMREEDKGKNRYLGYYYLIPKKQRKKDSFIVMQVFTEINFEVK